ncbi:two-component system, sensor histidine kinase YesM [Paenibacillus sp. UNCCL117]|uniref:cache domain-containing sensor histidine kinase n=1 Tax=unclassified Paenibacillus TaxID=185978 RepID=UPI00087E96EF|nr:MULTISPECIES: sensor histidine kinase [unclassified Paenibacillus]SDD56456.1 two-component system, sensor histidine kinase YesM [Paenibacillus sp. cl123]SFW51387.1 two-component system, sensor histidine kinase YesM [Paenibacillus sp. UNCCL117]
MRKSLGRKVYLYFVIIIALILLSVGVTGYWRSSMALESQYEGLLAQIVDNVLHETDLYLKNYERATVSALSSPLVKEALDLPAGSISEFYTSGNVMKSQVFQPLLINNPEISMVYIYGDNGFQVSDFNIHIVPFHYKAFEEYIAQLREESDITGKLRIQDSGFLDGHLTLVRKLGDRTSSSVFKGLMGFELRIGELNTLWKGIRLGESGYFFIVNSRGKILYHPDSSRVGKQLDGSQLQTAEAESDHLFEMPGEPGRVFFARTSSYSGWMLVASMSRSELRMPIAQLRQTTITVGIVTLLLASLLAYRFGQSIIRPVRLLERGMRQTERGQWTQVPLTGSRDEMDRLISSYNTMVRRLEELVERVYESELHNQEHQLKRQLAEFQALQLQINPHFLYNTLEIIICYAVIQKSSEIKDIVRSLSYMLRYSIRTDLEEITLANELKHVLYFMTIMNYRIQRDFEIDVRIPPELLLHNMVRLTLQPLVENVFKHAFPGGIEDAHKITIGARVDNETFLVTVEDNGCGMQPEELLLLMRRLMHSREEKPGGQAGAEGSIGLANVHNRIQMVFGAEYGLSVTSESGRGTIVTIRMPAPQQKTSYRSKSG